MSREKSTGSAAAKPAGSIAQHNTTHDICAALRQNLESTRNMDCLWNCRRIVLRFDSKRHLQSVNSGIAGFLFRGLRSPDLRPF